MEKFIQKRGFAPVKGAGKGSHKKYTDGAGRMIIVREEKDASLGVLKSTAEALGIKLAKLEELVGNG